MGAPGPSACPGKGQIPVNVSECCVHSTLMTDKAPLRPSSAP